MLIIGWQVIASEGEQKSAKALMEAARIMASSPSALQLRQFLMMMMMMMMIASIFPPCHDYKGWECVIIIFPPSDCDDDENNSRYLQTLHSISAEKNSTIIFPLPMELLGGFIDTQVIND